MSDRAIRYPDRFGDLLDGQPEVVVQHDDRALVHREATEGSVELVSVGDRFESMSEMVGPSLGQGLTIDSQRRVRRASAWQARTAIR